MELRQCVTRSMSDYEQALTSFDRCRETKVTKAGPSTKHVRKANHDTYVCLLHNLCSSDTDLDTLHTVSTIISIIRGMCWTYVVGVATNRGGSYKAKSGRVSIHLESSHVTATECLGRVS